MDILFAILLTIHNKKLALARGRRPGGFIALTLGLWFGFELTAYFIALDLYGISAISPYGTGNSSNILIVALIALAAAGLGGLIAYLVVKSCKPGDYYPVPPMAAYMAMPAMGASFAPPAQPLETPAKIDIIRDYSIKGDITSWKFILNGETVGNLGNGAARSTTTKQRQNTLRAVSDEGQEFMPLQFDIESDGHAEIHFKGDRFARESCTGILPMSMPAAPPSMPYTPPVILRTDALNAPAQISIIRDSHAESASAAWSFLLNGIPVGGLTDGQTLTAVTSLQQNMLRALPTNGVEPPPLMFIVQSGATAQIHFKNGAFLPYQSSGIMPPPYAPPMYAAQMPPPYGPGPFVPQANAIPVQPQPEPESSTPCIQCGAPVRYKDQYCRKCGAKQPNAEQN